MEHWLLQILVAGKCMDTAWGQVCPLWHPVEKTFIMWLDEKTISVFTRALSKKESAPIHSSIFKMLFKRAIKSHQYV